MKQQKTPHAHGIPVKKKYGQHFLREQSVIDSMLQAVEITAESSIFEIGCGDGFLTKSILATNCKRLWVFEIDNQWAEFVKSTYPDPRMSVFEENILDTDFTSFIPDKPWILLSNLPYQITFPILHLLQKDRTSLSEGVIMVQEEVAQKIMKTSGRGYGFISLYFQHYFSWKLLTKISPAAFYPPPAVFSRLLHFKPKSNIQPIPQEEKFWAFIKLCFSQPRRTLRNNLASTHYAELLKQDPQLGDLRAQQMSMQDLLALWKLATKVA